MGGKASSSAMVHLLWQRRQAPLAAPHAGSGVARRCMVCSRRDVLRVR
jgi:hypothetical protein